MIKISYVISFKHKDGIIQRRRFFDPRTASRWIQEMFDSYDDFRIVSVVGNVHHRQPKPETKKKKDKRGERRHA